jgi:hypothetical protein
MRKIKERERERAKREREREREISDLLKWPPHCEREREKEKEKEKDVYACLVHFGISILVARLEWDAPNMLCHNKSDQTKTSFRVLSHNEYSAKYYCRIFGRKRIFGCLQLRHSNS